MNDIANLKSKLNNAFDMKDLGEANHILGMRIVRDREKKVLFRIHWQGDYAFQYGREEGTEYSSCFICET